ncbi:cytochrome P450 [Acrasis kona]|uniref:Cytochrome P450 n=1 Tax=Acrasis kona TaxID=1008807 RepID=A0AAW2Z2J3_9EUKA
MVENMMVTLLVVPMLIFAIIKLLEYRSRTYVIDTRTGKPINNYVGFFASFERFFSKKHGSEKTLKRAKQFDFEPYLTTFMFGKNLVISQPELAKKVLLNWRKFEKLKILLTPDMTQLVGHNNLVFSNGEHWTNQRQVINPAFVNVDRFAQHFQTTSKDCIDAISSMLDVSQEIKVVPLMTALTLDVLGSTTFGYEFNYLKEIMLSEHQKGISESARTIESYDYVMNNMISFMKVLLQKKYHTFAPQETKRFQDNLKRFEGLIYSVIDRCRQRLASNTPADDYTQTLLDMMVCANDSEEVKLDDSTLRDNAIIMFIAGHDTTSNSLTYAMYSMCKYPDTQEKLYNEIIEKIGANKVPTVEQIHQLEYLNMFLKENLRLNAPVHLPPPRILSEDTELGHLKLKKGLMVNINIFAIHRNPHVWGQDAEMFRPERFLPEESKGRHNSAWIPFSGGPRTCIGNRFSLLEQKIFLVNLLQSFELSLPSPDCECKPQSFLLYAAPKDFKLNFKKRNQKSSP